MFDSHGAKPVAIEVMGLQDLQLRSLGVDGEVINHLRRMMLIQQINQLNGFDSVSAFGGLNSLVAI